MRFPLVCLGMGALVLAGCGGGGGSAGPAATEGDIRVRHESIDHLLEFADSKRIVVDTTEVARLADTGQIPISEEVTIPGVKSHARRVHVTYFKGSEVVGEAEAEVDLTDGNEVVSFHGNPVGPYALVSNDHGHHLTSSGQQMFIKGVGFDYTRFDQNSSGQWFKYVDPMIADLGANAIRTYGTPWTDGGANTPGSPAYQAQDVSAMLAFAAKHKITVLVGVFVDGSATDTRVQEFVQAIQNDRNFASVLGWCVGNEVGEPNFPRVEQLIKLIKAGMKSTKQVRPVMTALPAVSSGYIATINKTMPSLDWLGINVFYGCFDSAHCGGGYLNTQAASLANGGWKKPWVITEYYSYDIQAPDMPGQVLNGGNRYMLEANSTLNAQNYANSYSQYIASASAKKAGSVGGFMLNFGPPHNSKLVASWLEPLTYTGEFTPFVNPPWNHGADQYYRLEAVDAIAAIYGGRTGSQVPQIVLGADGDPQGITCTWKATLKSPGQKLAAGQSNVTASVMASSSQSLTFNWYLVGGNGADGYSGNIAGPGTNPQAYGQPTTIFLGNGTSAAQGKGVTQNTITFKVPSATTKNNYQLRVIVVDPRGGAATSSVAFALQ